MKRRFAPKLELLESRCTPTTQVTTTDGGHTLVFTGDGDKNTVLITQDDSEDELNVVVDGQTSYYLSSAITKITADLKGDEDSFGWFLKQDTSYSHGKTVVVNTGGGGDPVGINLNDGYGGGAWNIANSNLTIRTGNGKDDLNAAFGRTHGRRLDLLADMGADDDQAIFQLFGDITHGAEVEMRLLGGTGHDELEVKNRHDELAGELPGIDLDPDSTFAIDVLGGDGNDTITITHEGNVNGLLTLNADGGKNKDIITALVRLKVHSAGDVDAELRGGANNDRMGFQLLNEGGLAHILQAEMDGGTGWDRYATSTTGNVAKSSFEAVWFVIGTWAP